MPHRSLRCASRRAILVAAAALLPPAAAAPQEPTSTATQETVDVPGVFTEVIEVRVVNVEVVVTDALGNRVPALGREDFRITVDGEERPIDFWSEIRDGEAASSQADARRRLDPADDPSGEEAHSTSYLLFVDDSFTHARDRNLVLEKLAGELQDLGPRDRMAVVAFDGRELTMLSGWTHSPRVLAGALRDARARPSGGTARDREHRLNTATHSRSTGRQLTGLQHSYALRLGNQVERSVMAAVASLRSFSSPPGRKVMLLLAGSWPLSPAEFAVGSPTQAALDDAYATGVLGYDRLFGPLVDTANLLGYTLYPVDVAGTAGRIETDVPLGLIEGGGDQSFWGPEGNAHAGMRYLAEKTGGQAVIHEGRERALAEVAADTRSYYWLGFRLAGGESGDGGRAADDARHDIRVEILRPGLVVRSREGFVDLSRETEMTMMTESALLFGNPASTLAAQLRFGKPERVSRKVVKLRVDVGFPLDGIALEADGDRRTAGLALRLVAMDEDGARTPPVLETVSIDLPRPPEPGEVYWHSTELTLERRWHRVVAGVFDARSGIIRSSSAEIAP
jgi:VWFA-related protein